jgi:hypothetical protein
MYCTLWSSCYCYYCYRLTVVYRFTKVHLRYTQLGVVVSTAAHLQCTNGKRSVTETPSNCPVHCTFGCCLLLLLLRLVCTVMLPGAQNLEKLVLNCSRKSTTLQLREHALESWCCNVISPSLSLLALLYVVMCIARSMCSTAKLLLLRMYVITLLLLLLHSQARNQFAIQLLLCTRSILRREHLSSSAASTL